MPVLLDNRAAELPAPFCPPQSNATVEPLAALDWGQSATLDPFNSWAEKLQELGALRTGWDSYSAEPPSDQAIAAARRYLTALRTTRFEPTRVEASAIGGVGITHRRAHRKVYVEFYNDGSVHALFSDRTLAGMSTAAIACTLDSYILFIAQAREYLNG